MSKQYICTGTWKRNNIGDIISEWEYNKMPIEAKEHNYVEYVPKPELVLSQSIEIVEEKPTTLEATSGTVEELKKSWRSNFQPNKDEE